MPESVWGNKCQCHTFNHESEPDFIFFCHGIMVGSACTARALTLQSVLETDLGTDQAAIQKVCLVLPKL